MHFLIFALFISIFSNNCDSCIRTPNIDETAQIPLSCATCPDLPLTGAPGATTTVPGFNTGMGSIANSIIAPGCRQYTVTCNAIPAGGARAVIIGANMSPISLIAGSPGEKTVTLVCNNNGQIEGRTAANDPIIVTSVYCSNEN